MSASARELVTRALCALDHVEGRTKAERLAVEHARALLVSAERDLSGTLLPPLPPLPVPEGAREGISVESRAHWRRR